MSRFTRFGVQFLAGNGAGVKKMTNMRYGCQCLLKKQLRLLAPQRGALPVFAPAPLTPPTPCICTVSLVYPQAPGPCNFVTRLHMCVCTQVFTPDLALIAGSLPVPASFSNLDGSLDDRRPGCRRERERAQSFLARRLASSWSVSHL